MKLSEIKGKRQIAFVADIMELTDSLSGRKEADEFFDALKSARKGDGFDVPAAWSAFCKLAPILRDESIQDGIISAIATAKGMDKEEADKSLDVMSEVFELLTSDSSLFSFFVSTEQTQE